MTGEDSGTPTAAEAIPEPRADSPASAVTAGAVREERANRKVPYDEPGSLAMLLDMKIPGDDVFFDLLRFLTVKGLKRDPGRLHELVRSFAEQAEAPTD